MRNTYDFIDKEYLEKEYIQAKRTQSELARILECDIRVIKKKIKEYGMPLRLDKYDFVNKEYLEKEYIQERKSRSEIARILGCQIRVINRKIEEYGIQTFPNAHYVIDKECLERYCIQEKRTRIETARIVGCDVSIINKKIREYGIQVPSEKCKFNFINKEYLEKYCIQERLTNEQLAKISGCSTGLIKNRIKLYDIKKKPKKSINAQGMQFGDLTVIKDERNLKDVHDKKVQCKCSCGNLVDVNIFNLMNGHTKSCGCSLLKIGENHFNFAGYKNISLSHWSQIQDRAKQRGIDFNIDIKQVSDKFDNQGKRCFLSGIELSRKTASLDRLDSSLGYLYENVAWVHKDINVIKWDFELEYFLDMCFLVNNFQNLKNLQIITVKSHKWKQGHENISGKLWGDIQRDCKSGRRGKNREIFFDLSIEVAWKKYLDQGCRCALTGRPIYFPVSMKDFSNKTASLDRIDSNGGYTEDNVWWVHKHINAMKWKLDLDKFKDICGNITNHKKHIVSDEKLNYYLSIDSCKSYFFDPNKVPALEEITWNEDYYRAKLDKIKNSSDVLPSENKFKIPKFGVSFDKTSQKWVAFSNVNSKIFYIGNFHTKTEAACERRRFIDFHSDIRNSPNYKESE